MSAVFRNPRRGAAVRQRGPAGWGPAGACEALEQRRFFSAGELDPTFGGGGRAVIDSGSALTQGDLRALVVRPDGKVIGLGQQSGATSGQTLVRRRADGSPDATFDGDGRLDIGPLGADDDFSARGIAVDAAGRILVAGTDVIPGGPPDFNFAVARYNDDGALDATFGTGGRVVEDFSASRDDDEARSVAVDSSGSADPTAADYNPNYGKIVAAGEADFGVKGFGLSAQPDHRLVLTRYDPDGRPDPGFGTDGQVVLELADTGFIDGGSNVLIDSQGRLLVTARGQVVRLDPQGNLDPTFGAGGRASTGAVTLDGMALDAADNVLVVSAVQGQGNFQVVRLSALDGQWDANFSGDGNAFTDVAGGDDGAVGVAADRTTGRIVVAGYAFNEGGTGYDVALAAYEPDGDLDPTFGQGGVELIDFGPVGAIDGNVDDFGWAVAFDSYGRAVVGGSAGNRADPDKFDYDFALARCLGDSTAAAPPGVALPGSDVAVEPLYAGTDEPPLLTVTFDTLGQTAGVTVERVADATELPQLPSGFSYGDGATTYVFEIKTTATDFGSAEVCFGYDDALVDETNLSLLHYDEANGGWVDVTTTRDLVNNQICGVVSGFSPFAIVQRTVQQVQIDVRPDSINVDANGVIPVTLFSTPEFDARRVDLASVVFADAHAIGGGLEDADGDGDLDLVLRFRVQDTSLGATYRSLLIDDHDADGVLDSTRQVAATSLTGATLDDGRFESSDTVNLFLAGKALRSLLDQLAAAQWI